MRSATWILLAAFAVTATPQHASSQDLSSCAQINTLAEDGRIGDALWELDLCRTALETAWLDGLLEALNVEIEGLQPSGGSVSGMMGINTVEITHGDVETKFTSGTGAAESPMAGLSSLAGIANALGVREEGVEEVRLGRRTTGRLEEKSGGQFTLTVSLDEGVLVQEGPDKDQIQAVATAVIRILQDYLNN